MREIIPILSRRELLAYAPLSLSGVLAAAPAGRPKIAAIITEYRHNSHADVIAGRLLAGYEHNGVRRDPAVQVVSMFTDQTPKNDMSRAWRLSMAFRFCRRCARR